MYLYTFCCFDFYIWHLYFIFCVLPFVPKILSLERFLSFIVFCLLRFNFRLFTFVFCVQAFVYCILALGFRMLLL